MPKDKDTIFQTRLIISKSGKVLLENKTNPQVDFEVRLNVGLHLFSGDKPVNIYNLGVDDFEVYWRMRYEHKVKVLGEETGETKMKWSNWQPYPKDRIFFQGRTRIVSQEPEETKEVEEDGQEEVNA
jgi:hypothetical protein